MDESDAPQYHTTECVFDREAAADFSFVVYQRDDVEVTVLTRSGPDTPSLESLVDGEIGKLDRKWTGYRCLLSERTNVPVPGGLRLEHRYDSPSGARFEATLYCEIGGSLAAIQVAASEDLALTCQTVLESVIRTFRPNEESADDR